MPQFFFLTGEERQKFETPGRVIPRRITQQVPHEDPASAVPLTQHLLQRVEEQIKKRQAKDVLGYWFEGLVVTVQPRDGMSWTAEATTRAYLAAHPTVRAWTIPDSPPPDDLPAVAHHVGASWFLTVAAKRGLADPFLTWRSWQVLAAVGVVLAVMTVAQIFGDAPVKGLPLSARNATLALLVAGMTLAGAVLRGWLGAHTYAAALKSFLERIQGSEASDAFTELVDDAARRLQGGPFPRLVVVENYQTVDRLTQEVIERYFSTFAEDADGSETWVVFEPPGAGRLARRVIERRRADEPHGRGYRGMSLWAQVFLNADERRLLLERLDRKVEATAGLAAVKLLCEGIGDGTEVQTVAAEHRKMAPRGEKGYTELDVLFFLSLTTTRLQLNTAVLIDRLLDQTPRRSKILPAVFRVRQLRKDDIRSQLDRLPTLFPTLVRRSGTGAKSSLAIGADVTAALRQHHGELQLPDPSLVHAFWAMYWFDGVFNSPKADEAFWIREIATHLTHAGLSQIERQSVQHELEGQLFEVAHFAAKASLRIGLFDQVAPLLQRCTDYLFSAPAASAAHRASVLRTAWEAYSVFGDEALLSVILENAAANVPSDSEAVPVEIALFLDSVALSADARVRLGPAMALGSPTTRAHELADYARARSGWFVQSALRRAPPVPRLRLHEAESLPIADSARSAAARLSPDRAQPMLIDLLALTGGLWCLAVYPSAAVGAVTASGNVTHILPALFAGSLETAAAQLAALTVEQIVDLAETSALIARDLRHRDFSRKLDTNVLREGLSVEISATALAACVAATIQARTASADIPSAATFARIRGVRDIVGETLSYPLPPLPGPEALSAQGFLLAVDDLLRMCGLVWQKMGVPQLGAFVLIRRLAFRSLAGLREASDIPDTLFERVNAMAARPDFIGVISNLELADYQQRTAEISAHFLDQAARVAITGEMGDRVKQDLALMALFGYHSFGADPDPLVAELQRMNFTTLRHGLVDLPSTNLAGTVLALLNIGRRLRSPALSDAWREEIDHFANTVSDPAAREEIDRLLEVSRFRRDAADSAEVVRLLDRWQPHRSLWLYPWLLNTLLDTGHETDRVFREAEAALERNPEEDVFNTWLVLALAVAEHAQGRSVAAPASAIGYLEGAAVKWASGSPARMNLRMYTALAKAGGPLAGKYHAERIRWQQAEIEYHHLRTLPQLAGRREFFLLFFEYFDLMSSWGLIVDDVVTFKARTNVDEGRRRSELAHWNERRFSGLMPIRQTNGAMVVSSDFLCIGLYLCRPPLDTDEAFEEHRRMINALAKRHLPTLLDSIRTMRDVPPFLRQVFDRHSRRLEEMLAAA